MRQRGPPPAMPVAAHSPCIAACDRGGKPRAAWSAAAPLGTSPSRRRHRALLSGRRRATPSDRPELSSMADDYAQGALSQRAAFEATFPSALAAARLFADEQVLRVVDLGAADGVNSHGLIRDLAEQRAGRSLVYALVDLPTNAWGVAGEHLRHDFGEAA